MNSEQRRMEIYQIINMWKIMEVLAPSPSLVVNWSVVTIYQKWQNLPNLKGKVSVQTLRTQSFQVSV